MTRFFEFFSSRHLLANILMIIALGGGLLVATTVRRDLFPRVELNQVVVRTLYPGASPEDVELNVTNRIETQLKSLGDIKKIESVSLEDLSIVGVYLNPDLNDRRVDAMVLNVREAVARAEMPPGLPEPPRVERVRISELPILDIGVAGAEGMSYRELREQVRIIAGELKEIEGVAGVKKYGFRPREVKIEIDPVALAQKEVALHEVVRALKERNIRSTGGTLESFTARKNLITLAQFREPREAEDAVIRSNFLGGAVRVGDVARIHDGFKEERVLSRINGQENMIVLSVRKRESADIIRTTARIRRYLEEHPRPGIEFHFSNQIARYVQTSFDVVVKNGLTGLVLVGVVLSLFLNVRTAVWVALGIPVSLLGAVALLPFFDVYLDVVTLTAMILLLGILVDDAIIISESIHAFHAAGMNAVQAAGAALKKMFLPVSTTILTTILAFLPLFFIPGVIGKFIFVIPLVISLALIVSLVEGLFILPAHVVHGLDGKQGVSPAGGPGVPGEPRPSRFDRYKEKYRELLGRVLDRRYRFISGFVLVLITSLVLAFLAMKIIVFPTKGAEEFAIYLETPVGTSLEETSRRMARLEKTIQELPGDEVYSFITIVGNQEGYVSENHIGVIRVNLAPFSERSRTADEIAAVLRERSKDSAIAPLFTKIMFDVKESGPEPGKQIELRLLGADDARRSEAAGRLMKFLGDINGVRDLGRSDTAGKPQVEIKLNYERMGRAGVTAADVAGTIRTAFDGEVATRVQYGEDRTDFRVLLPKDHRRDLEYLQRMEIPNRDGKRVGLQHLVAFGSRSGPARYDHYNGERYVLVSAGVNEDIISPTAVVDRVNAEFAPRLPAGIRLRVEGEAKRKKESTGHALRAFLAAVVCIYFLLVLLFNSFSQPLLILAAVPFGLIGVVFAFLLHNEPLSFMAMLGVVGLTGVVVNDSLVLIDHANGLRRAAPERSLRDIVIQAAADRMRPIVMTTVTTAAGLLPLAYGIGGEDPSNAPMALALGWGLLFATFLILLLLPCLILAGDDLGRWCYARTAPIIARIKERTRLVFDSISNYFSMITRLSKAK